MGRIFDSTLDPSINGAEKIPVSPDGHITPNALLVWILTQAGLPLPLSGSGVPGAGLGKNGDWYYDFSGGQLLYYKSGGAWNVIELNPSIINGGALVAANIVETITNGVTTNAPSENAVFDALALKVNTSRFPQAFYKSLITQSGASTAPVIDNTPQNELGGVPVWSVDSDGKYLLTLAGAFPVANKIISWAVFSDAEASNNKTISLASDGSGDALKLIVAENGVPADDLFGGLVTVYIEVFP